MESGLSWERAEELLHEYNQEPFHIEHAETLSGVMGYFAERHAPDQVEFWKQVGLLHDLDYERFPEEHCVKTEEILQQEGATQEFIHAVASHGWGMTDSPYEPDSKMEKILFATDELTGLISAAVLMRPSKSVMDFSVKSLKKKFKDKSFAAGCSRDTITQGANELGWELDELFERTIEAMQAIAPDRDTFEG